VQFIKAASIKIHCLTVKAVRFALSHFTLSLVTTPTENLSVKLPCDSKKPRLYCRMETYTTVSVQEFIPIDYI